MYGFAFCTAVSAEGVPKRRELNAESHCPRPRESQQKLSCKLSKFFAWLLLPLEPIQRGGSAFAPSEHTQRTTMDSVLTHRIARVRMSVCVRVCVCVFVCVFVCGVRVRARHSKSLLS